VLTCNLQQILAKVAAYISQIESQHQSEVPTGHDFILFIRQLPTMITNSADAAELALLLSQKNVAALYSSQTRLQRDCYSSLLLVLCQAFPKILKELHSWITYSNDEVRNVFHRQELMFYTHICSQCYSVNTMLRPFYL
jgi:hypothetical protein